MASDASVAESFYGLRRAPLASGAKLLSSRQRWLSLLALTALPYARAKAERAYEALGGGGGEAARLGLLDAPTPSSTRSATRLQRWFLTAYPLAHAAGECASILGG